MLLHGVVAADRSEALVAHVQLDESAHNRGVFVRVPGLDPEAALPAWPGRVRSPRATVSMSVRPFAGGPTAGRPVTGAVLGARGFWMPRMRPETVTLVLIAASAGRSED